VSSRIKPYQTTFDKSQWKEDPTDQRMRTGLTATSPDYMKRLLFPLSLRMKQHSRHYPGLLAGTVVKFARTRLSPTGWPIEALVFDKLGNRIHCSFSSDEAELLNPVEES
jgi:hypothetical protein